MLSTILLSTVLFLTPGSATTATTDAVVTTTTTRTVTAPDIALTFDDDMSATATAPPKPEPKPKPVETAATTTTETASPSETREVEEAKASAATTTATASTQDTTPVVASGDVQTTAASMLAARGWGGSDQWSAFSNLVNRESGWNIHAVNASSGACGLPQALPCSKLSSAGADYWDNPVTQLTWMMDYIAGRYGDPVSAWAHSQSTGWY